MRQIFTRQPIEKDQIPTGVINEMASCYEIDWSTYGTGITKDAASKQLRFESAEFTEEFTTAILDPDTFQKEITAVGLREMYIAHGVWDEENKKVQLQEVCSIDKMVIPN